MVAIPAMPMSPVTSQPKPVVSRVLVHWPIMRRLELMRTINTKIIGAIDPVGNGGIEQGLNGIQPDEV